MSTPANPLILGYLRAATDDLYAARKLAQPPASRLAAYHLQQASEKLAKAVLVARGIHTTKEHRVAQLLQGLAATDRWKPSLEPLEDFDDFATAFRYPGTSGKLREGPTPERLLADADALELLLQEAHRDRQLGGGASWWEFLSAGSLVELHFAQIFLYNHNNIVPRSSKAPQNWKPGQEAYEELMGPDPSQTLRAWSEQAFDTILDAALAKVSALTLRDARFAPRDATALRQLFAGWENCANARLLHALGGLGHGRLARLLNRLIPGVSWGIGARAGNLRATAVKTYPDGWIFTDGPSLGLELKVRTGKNEEPFTTDQLAKYHWLCWVNRELRIPGGGHLLLLHPKGVEVMEGDLHSPTPSSGPWPLSSPVRQRILKQLMGWGLSQDQASQQVGEFSLWVRSYDDLAQAGEETLKLEDSSATLEKGLLLRQLGEIVAEASPDRAG